jgi:F0F1-type ATP synthase membrane subunit c/vacuolar-type H+-ATPase subunit K
VGLGLGLGGTAGWLWQDAGARETALAKKLKLKGPDGKVTGISESEANAENDAIGTRKTMAAIGGGLGVVALGAGLWLGLTGSSGSQTARVEPLANTFIVLVPNGVMVHARS